MTQRKTCSRCSEPTPKGHKWTLYPCAAGREIKGLLCRRCDEDCNALILSFFRVRNRRQLMEAYRGH